jgi:hypothetical protein
VFNDCLHLRRRGLGLLLNDEISQLAARHEVMWIEWYATPEHFKLAQHGQVALET